MNTPSKYSDWGLLALRVAVAASFIIHGVSKWAVWSAPEGAMPAGMTLVMKILSIVEPLGGVAILLGILTSWASLGLIVIMIGAIYTKIAVWKIPYAATTGTGWEYDVALLAAAIALLTLGAGKMSLDRYCESRKNTLR